MPRRIDGEGPLTAKVAIVGEAPGAEEERKGRPFVGASGALLEGYMNSVGIFRPLCYLTNVIKERPPNNDVSKFIIFKKKQVEETEAFQAYLKELYLELSNCSCNVIGAAGNVALYALTGLTGINNYRGSVLECSLIPGKKVVPLIHPAAALRTYIWRHFIQFDLVKLKRESEFPGIIVTPRTYDLNPSFSEILTYLDQLATESLVAFDIEIVNGEVSHISFSHRPDYAMCIEFYGLAIDQFTPDQELEVWNAVAKVLEDPDIEKIAHNGAFDATFLMEKYGIKTKSLHDTMIAQAILYPDFPKSLAFVNSIYTDIPYYKDEGKEQFKHGTMADHQVFKLYSAKDSISLQSIFPAQLKELQRLGNLETYESQRRLLEPILYMVERGIAVDTVGIKKYSNRIEVDIAELEQKLDLITGGGVNPNSPKQLIEYFYGKKRIKPYTKKGSITVDEKALKRISGKGFEEASLILQIRGLKKLKSTYIDAKLDDRGRLRYSINPVGTKFGRFSSGQDIFGRGTNVQNLPPIMKRYLKPDEGYVAFEIDLSQAENRIVAYLGNEHKMIQAFENRVDIHSRTAGLLFNMPEEQVIELEKLYKQTGDKKYTCQELAGGKYTHRYWGKRSNHALNYDMSANMAALQWEVELKEATPIVNKYHAAYPGVRAYQSIIRDQLNKNRTLTNLYGRRYRFMDRLERDLYKQGYSYIAQSTVADKINRHGLAPIYLNGGPGQLFEPVELLCQVHDSIVFQIPISTGWQQISFILLSIIKTLEQPITSWHGREFVIPCGVKMLLNNLKTGIEWGGGELPPEVEMAAKLLEEAFEKLLTKKRET